MKVISKGQNNTLIFTLTEKETLTNPYYLCKAVNLGSRKEKKFILASDLSSFKQRYNQFTLTESSTEILTSGTVSLDVGDWEYHIYEQASATNLNEQQATSELEVGQFRVKAATASNTYNYYDGQDKEYKSV